MTFFFDASAWRRTVAGVTLGLAAAFSASAVHAEEAQRGGHLRVGLALEPTSLDPVLGRSGGDAYYYRQIFDQIVDADQSLNPDEGSSLAESWEFSTDPDTITFTLRQGVTFHDGTPFNAEAVRANIERILDVSTQATPRSAISRIESVDVLDDYTVRFNLSGPWGAGLGMLADRGGVVSSPEAIAALAQDYGWSPSGTGPFKVEEVVPGSFVRLVRNEDYWGTDEDGNRLPYLDQITLQVIKDETVLASALRAGEIDIAYLPMREVDNFEQDQNFQVERMDGGAIASMIAFNTAIEPMDNIHLRRAVMHAINPEDINRAVYFDKALVADSGLWPVNSWVHEPSSARPEYDLDKAREELAAGGRPEGFTIDIVTWNSPVHQQAAEIVRAQLGRVGIVANIDVLTVGPATEQFFQGQAYPVYLTSWSRYPEPDWIAALNFKSDGYYNPSNAERPEVDALVDEGASIYDQEERKLIYNQINDTVLGEAWAVPLLYGVTYAAAANRVGNLDTLIAWDGKMSLKRIWLDQR